jgi:hypothetical protein
MKSAMETQDTEIKTHGGSSSIQSEETSHRDDNDEDWSRDVQADDADESAILTSVPVHTSNTDDNDDDDEDNWSRQVETDDLHRLPSSITGEVTDMDGEEVDGSALIVGRDVMPPLRDEPTLKEKLVERERQRRVETERGRWKRQFAMAAHTEADDEENHFSGLDEASMDRERDSAENESGMAVREANSVAGTVGEDTVAPIEMLDDDHSKMNYPMERFLKEQGTVIEEGMPSIAKKEPPNQGVVMERFLQEPPMFDAVSNEEVLLTPQIVHRSVSFDPDNQPNHFNEVVAVDTEASNPNDFLNMSTSFSIAAGSTDRGAIPEDILGSQSNNDLSFTLLASANASIANASTTCLPPSEDDRETGEVLLEIPATNDSSEQINIRHSLEPPTEPIVVLGTMDEQTDLSGLESPSQPRVVLRLTEAEIQEMAAIDEASRSNAPPSERDDMSELGELVSDFGPVHMDHPSMSQGTPTTAMESASSVANQSGVAEINILSSDHERDDQLSIDATETGSVSSHGVASSAGGDVSLTANPPSDIGRDDEDEDEVEGRHIHVTEITPLSPNNAGETQPLVASESRENPLPRQTNMVAESSASTVESGDVLEQNSGDEDVVNRRMRPGMFNYDQYNPHGMKKAKSFPDQIIHTSAHTQHIEGFDFDKNDPNSPIGVNTNDLLVRNEMWSPGLSPKRPYRGEYQTNNAPSLPSFPYYGTKAESESLQFDSGQKTTINGTNGAEHGKESERRPLLEGFPSEVLGHERRGSNFTSLTSIRTMDDVHSLAESVFSDIRSESTATKNSISNEALDYLESSILKRAFPERLFALTVTLIFEIPVLFMVAGGSDRLCYMIGRTKYQLLVGFLPLSSAISGNVGLQSSTLTTRAISHGQVRVENYSSWLLKEIGAAFYLGIGMGGLLGVIAYVASGFSIAFGLTVMSAQFISILTAGCTGTFAPLIFTFIFEKDSGKWGGPLETAVQDIVGSFAMVVISYQILLWFGPYDVAENDVCGAESL